jgi:pilus assembly protein CpaF
MNETLRERERGLRDEVLEELRREMDAGALLQPGQAEVELVRRVSLARLDAFNRRAASLGDALLADTHGVVRRIMDDILGLGPLQPLLDDGSVEEIIVNGPNRVFAIAGGRKRLTDVEFADDEELLRLVRRVIGPIGRRLDDSNPIVDARLPDGSRLNAVIPPLTSGWTCLTIRKFLLRAHTLSDLVRLGTLTDETAAFLEAAVQTGHNVLISGGTGTGKTTCLNALCAAIGGAQERVVTIEETQELQLESMLPDCVSLQARLPNLEGAGGIAVRGLVKNALRMRPTRIIVGEVRGAEALDMLSAMNSGHEGSMCTIHANGPRQALSKLGLYALMAEEALPVHAVTEMIAEAVNLVVHLRLDASSGRRIVSSIYEVTGMEEDAISGSEVYALTETGLEWTGIRPRAADRIEGYGLSWERQNSGRQRM